MTLLASPVLAVGFGAFLLCAETCLHFESIVSLPGSWLSLPIHDWVAASFLIYGGVKSRRDWDTGRVYQAAAWAFSASLLGGAFFWHLENWPAEGSADGLISERALVMIIGVLLAISLCGLLSTIRLKSPTAAK